MSCPQTILPSIADCTAVYENLPLPVVYYPRQHGTFLAFAQDMKSTPVLCGCASQPVRNLLRLRPDLQFGDLDGSLGRIYFPARVGRRIAGWSGRGRLPVLFVPGLCHRCNHTTPELRYCDETHGDSFVQRFGWYVNQAYLRLGMLPQGQLKVGDDCPPDCRSELEAVRSVEQAFQQQVTQLLDTLYAADRGVARGGDAPRALGAMDAEIRRLAELRHKASDMRQEFKGKIECMVKREIGIYA